GQLLFAVEPIDALVVHPMPLASQQDGEPAIPEPPAQLGQGSKSLPQGRRRIPVPPILPGRPGDADEPTGPALTHPKLGHDRPHRRPLRCGRQTFFRTSSLSAWLSKVRSATRRFSRPFSSSSCRRRRSSLTSRPPYRAFQRKNVCSLTPWRRQTSAVLAPA